MLIHRSSLLQCATVSCLPQQRWLPPRGGGNPQRPSEVAKGGGRPLLPATLRTRLNRGLPGQDQRRPVECLLVVRQWGATVPLPPLHLMSSLVRLEQGSVEGRRPAGGNTLGPHPSDGPSTTTGRPRRFSPSYDAKVGRMATLGPPVGEFPQEEAGG